MPKPPVEVVTFHEHWCVVCRKKVKIGTTSVFIPPPYGKPGEYAHKECSEPGSYREWKHVMEWQEVPRTGVSQPIILEANFKEDYFEVQAEKGEWFLVKNGV